MKKPTKFWLIVFIIIYFLSYILNNLIFEVITFFLVAFNIIGVVCYMDSEKERMGWIDVYTPSNKKKMNL